MFQLLIYNDFIAVIPELYLIISASIILFYSVIYTTSPFFDYPLLVNNTSWLSIQVLLFTLFLNINNTFYDIVLFNNLIIIDFFNIVIKTFVLLSSILILIMSLRYNQVELLNNSEYSIIILFSIVGTLFFISSCDLLTAYISIELQSFCSYLLTSIKRNSEFSTEAGLKYFILGAFSSGFLLFGCSLVYGFTGTTNYMILSILIINNDCFSSYINGIVIGSLFILVAFLFKFSAAPFHVWSPDIYEGAPTTITAFFIIVQKLGLVIFFLRLFFNSFYGIINFWQVYLTIACFSSMLVGCFGALWQTKLKRLFAFSSITHVGYLLIALCCISFESIYALVFYLCIYVITNVGSFIILLIVRKNHNYKRIKYVEDLLIVAKTNYILGIYVVITFFSIAGVPPLAGFFSKMFIFFSSISQSMYSLAIVGILTSVVSCFYYLKIIQISFFEKENKLITLRKIDKESAYLITVANFFLIAFFFHPDLFSILIHLSIFDLFLL
jgi:proton-translocating NADH-quinone oxidoreductase chain N